MKYININIPAIKFKIELGFFAVLKAKILKMFLIFKGGKAVVLGAGVVSVPLYTFLDKYKGMS